MSDPADGGASSDATAVADRVQLPLTFDVERLRADVRALSLGRFFYYSVLMLTEPGGDGAGPDRPAGPANTPDGSWARWVNTPALNACPYLMEVVDTFRAHTTVTLVRLLRLEAGAVIKEHTDPTLALEVENSVVRLHVPIETNDAVQFLLNHEVVRMQPGECWYLRLSDPHEVVNGSATERIHLSIDMIPNAWVRSLIAGA